MLQLVKQVAEAKIAPGVRVLRNQLYPVKVDNTNHMAVLNRHSDILPGAAEALGKENEVQIVKII